MNLKDITTKCFIMALIIRDDGERLLLGSGRYEFKEDQKHFAANTFSNDVVEVQGNDGVFLAGQVRRAATQVFDGFVGDGTTSKADVEQWRQDFLKFFRKEHFYKVIYIFPDGTSIQRRQGFIVDAPAVPELYEIFPEYHIGLNFEDVNYYTYAEDDDGAEKYARLVELIPYTPATTGGLMWDETGAMWDETGAMWSAGGGAQENIVDVDSIDVVQPIWHVVGPCTNPSVTVLTTGTTLTCNGTVAEGQELVVDNFRQTALLSGTSVIESMSGDWLLLAPGANRVIYNVNIIPTPGGSPTIDDLTYMQDFAKHDSAGIQSIVNSMVEEQVYTLKDSRDQQDYKITKAKGGFVLMCENLRIGSNEKETVLKAADSDFEGEDITLPKGDNKDFDGYGIQKLYIDETYGGFYNYLTATAGQGTQEFTGKTNQSILPKGWTLMTPEQITQLILAYGGDNAEGSAALRAAPLNLQLGGRLYQNDHNSNVGYYMSSNVDDSGNATHLRLEPSRAFTQAYVKVIGTNIRGILRTGGVII